MSNQYNVLIDFAGVLLLGVIFITERTRKRHGDAFVARQLHCLMVCCALVFAVDIPGLLLDGRAFPGARALLWCVDTAYWIFQVIYCWLWLRFADYWAYASKERLRKRRLIYAAPMLAELLIILANPFTGWAFTLDGANVYARGRLYLWNMLPYIVYIAAAAAVTIRYSADPERRRRCLSLIVYMFLPVCGVVMDMFVYGISWVWPMVALSLLMVYLNVQQQAISEERLAAAKLEAELTEGRVAIMLSQIQPHFINNALNTIYVLCLKDPPLAASAVSSFAEFLRGNMDSLTQRRPIPLEKELEHLNSYLAIEKLRFPQISVELDLKATGFTLPPLTIQPLVENAVRYGVGCRPEGGTVKISTWEDESCFHISVADDGEGFDPRETQYDGRSHIGIDNTQGRIASMCGGSLRIHSEKGVGTVVEIDLPKGARAI